MGMRLHNLPFIGGELTGLKKYLVGNANLADIVHRGGQQYAVAKFFV